MWHILLIVVRTGLSPNTVILYPEYGHNCSGDWSRIRTYQSNYIRIQVRNLWWLRELPWSYKSITFQLQRFPSLGFIVIYHGVYCLLIMEAPSVLFINRLVLNIADIALFMAVNILTPRCSHLFIDVHCICTNNKTDALLSNNLLVVLY